MEYQHEYAKAYKEEIALSKRSRRRDVVGYAYALYSSIKNRLRYLDRYKGKKLNFDKFWFVGFALLNPQYKALHKQWVIENYDLKYAPTVDRIDSNKGYLKDNIQFLCFSENSSKGNRY